MFHLTISEYVHCRHMGRPIFFLLDLLRPKFDLTNMNFAFFIIDPISFLCSFPNKLPIARPCVVLAETPFFELPLELLLTILCLS